MFVVAFVFVMALVQVMRHNGIRASDTRERLKGCIMRAVITR